MRTIPIRPLKVTENTATGSIIAIGFAISLIPLALLILLFALVYPGLRADSQIAKNAVKVPQAIAHGDIVSTVVLSTANLPIDYGIQGGKKFKSQRWAFVFGEFHHQKPLQVYHLQGSPEIATTNWAIDALPLRWSTFWAFAVAFAFGVLLVWALTAVAIHNAKSLRRTASNPAAIEAAILSGNQIKNNRYWNYSWQLPNGKTRKNLVAWSPERKPYFTSATEDRALAIVCGKGLAHLVDANGRPFDLGSSELEAIAKELRSA
ncbi:MAG: hypothetical protein JO275_03250 [Verrucomicrobia bacterium]|nr:hypothetical protein [Verrucomicrobiota bacterium]